MRFFGYLSNTHENIIVCSVTTGNQHTYGMRTSDHEVIMCLTSHPVELCNFASGRAQINCLCI